MGYVVDTLFRSDRPDPNTTPEDVRAEATRIIASGLRNGDVPAADKTYLAQLVAARTGISQAESEKRVNDVIAKAKDVELKARQAADTARKVAATAAFRTPSTLPRSSLMYFTAAPASARFWIASDSFMSASASRALPNFN